MRLSLIRVIGRRKYLLSPVRWVDLQPREDGMWQSTGPLPKIELHSAERGFPCGWVMLFLDVKVLAADTAFGEIHAHTGRDGNALTALRVPRSLNGTCFVRLPDVVKKLEYRPIKGMG